jgi:cyclic-di-AMP phosphodiesterase PgpH
VRVDRKHRVPMQRVGALLGALLVVPGLVSLATIADDAPLRVGEPAPRTVVADQFVRVVDAEATDTARRTAAATVEPVERFDAQAQSEIIADVRSVFAAAREARQPRLDGPSAGVEGDEPEPTVPSPATQLAELRDRVDILGDEGLQALVDLSDSQLANLEGDTVSVAQQLARGRVRSGELDAVLDEQLPVELALRNFPAGTAQTVVEPLVRAVMRPTVVVDPDATDAARERAAERVTEVVRTYRQGEIIVREGEVVDSVEMLALEQAGLTGTEPQIALLRAFVAMVLVTAVLVGALRQMQPRVFASGRKMLLLSVLTVSYTLITVGIGFVADVATTGWWFAVPAGAYAMLASVMLSPLAGVGTVLPAVTITMLVGPSLTSLTVYVAAIVLGSVPLVTDLSTRGALRSATLRAGLVAPVLAVTAALVFGPRDQVVVAGAAGLVGGVLTAMVVQGLLPFLETLFRLPTATALLDLADRNHPLLRELEQKALGSYNHSVMVASLVERACREVGANALLGSVAALYHDIGKVRQPHFFIENQQGIANPHDDLEPEISAVIIQNHVVDGVEMAREYRLPPEVVACIGSHHGTMLVTFFYRQAVERAGGAEHVDEEHFRYKGTKPRSKEAAILLMADCCEATTRSMAMDRGTLPREEIESTVERLIAERLEDAQFDECALTFQEMSAVKRSIVEALVGIYHPRIAYPAARGGATAGSSGDAAPEQSEERVEA